MDKNEVVMTLEEAAAFLKLPKQTMYKLAQEGRIPGRKAGRQWRFHRDELERWLKGEEK